MDFHHETPGMGSKWEIARSLSLVAHRGLPWSKMLWHMSHLECVLHTRPWREEHFFLEHFTHMVMRMQCMFTHYLFSASHPHQNTHLADSGHLSAAKEYANSSPSVYTGVEQWQPGANNNGTNVPANQSTQHSSQPPYQKELYQSMQSSVYATQGSHGRMHPSTTREPADMNGDIGARSVSRHNTAYNTPYAGSLQFCIMYYPMYIRKTRRSIIMGVH